MIESLIGQYFARAWAVAQNIGIDAYFIDESNGRVVRLQPNGSSSFLRSLDDGPVGRISASLIATGKAGPPAMPTPPGAKSMNGQRKPFVVEVKRAKQLAWKERKLLSGPGSIRRLPWQSAEARQRNATYKPTHSQTNPAGKADGDR
ncbi:hypothetical protein ACFPOB_00010 [Bosea eneae]|jgi:hypothetical protein|uniref:Uncharacterized protein n=1 Tax=Bosea eneae TaxID=151454 RepID=A0ABW0IIE2_9HYPH